MPRVPAVGKYTRGDVARAEDEGTKPPAVIDGLLGKSTDVAPEKFTMVDATVNCPVPFMVIVGLFVLSPRLIAVGLKLSSVYAVCWLVLLLPVEAGTCSEIVDGVPVPVPRPDWIVRLPPAVLSAVPARAPWVERVCDEGLLELFGPSCI